MRALGRADDPTTGAKETPGFHRPSMGKPNSQWVLTGCQKKAPKCGRWVVLMTQRPVPKRLVVGSSPHDPTPALRTATQKKMRAIPSSLWASFGTAALPIVSKSQRD